MANSESLAGYSVRKAIAHDVPFIMASWLSSWRTSRYAGCIRNCDYFSITRSLIEDLIARGATLIVADAGDTLLGWACGEVKDDQTVLHYVYVKDPFLRRGIEDRLLESLPGVKPGWFTFYQDRLEKAPGWKHTPEMARRKTL